MSNIQDIRAQLRAEAGASSGPRSIVVPALAGVAGCAALAGVVYYLFFVPVIVPLKPSAAEPTFRQVTGQTPAPAASAPQVGEARAPSAPQNAARYAGLSFRQTGKAADEVCFARAHTRFPHWSKTPRLTTKTLDEFAVDDMPHFNELMHCLLTEAPVRYCSSGQRSMIATEIAMYFRVLASGNKGLDQFRADMVSPSRPGKLDRQFGVDPAQMARINRLEYTAEPRVVAAIEARFADGTLGKSERDIIAAAAPAPLRQRFANVTLATPACAAQPWWAFWRTL